METAPRLKLLLISWLVLASTLVCTTSYITPEILTATAGAANAATTVPTITIIIPASQPTDSPEAKNLATQTDSPRIAETLVEETPEITNTPAPVVEPDKTLSYFAQPGDTLHNLAVRFNVDPGEIASNEPIPQAGFINPGQLLIIPERLGITSPAIQLMPDSEVIFSNSASDLDVKTYVSVLNGKLSGYQEYLGTTGYTTGAEIIERVALENSVNPRLLLSLLQYQSNWVFGQPASLSQTEYPMGYYDHKNKDLYNQVVWAANQLSIGYYGWREGKLTEIHFKDNAMIRLAPTLNAGTVALMYFFSQAYPDAERWVQVLDTESGFVSLHSEMFGDPQARAATTEPLIPPDLAQPEMTLPFMRNQSWSYTGGPHGAWEHEGAQAALDFAPGSMEPGCVKSETWVLAASAGVIARKSKGVIVIDLDGDGNEHTGWSMLYLHLSNIDHLKVGQWVDQGDLLGHPSCEGGISTGTHVHLARKYNGEWISAGGAVPFNLGGWVAHDGDEPYLGTLTRGDETIKACSCSAYYTHIIRTDDDP
jgi:LasA protease